MAKQKETKTLTRVDKMKALGVMLEERKGEIAKSLPPSMIPERFLRLAYMAIQSSSKLAECTPASLVSAVYQAAQVGLELDPTLQEGALVPYKGQAKFQPMYQGLLKLAYQNERVAAVDAAVVYKNDKFEIIRGTAPRIHHVPLDKERGQAAGAYAVCFSTTNGAPPIFEYMSFDEIEAIRARAPFSDRDDSPWTWAWGEMAKKTVLKRLWKRVPRSTKSEIADRAQLALRYDDEAGTPDQTPPPILDVEPEEPEPAPEPEPAKAPAGASQKAAGGPKANGPAPQEPQPAPEPAQAQPPSEEGDFGEEEVQNPFDPQPEEHPSAGSALDDSERSLLRDILKKQQRAAAPAARAWLTEVCGHEVTSLGGMKFVDLLRVLKKVDPERYLKCFERSAPSAEPEQGELS